MSSTKALLPPGVTQEKLDEWKSLYKEISMINTVIGKVIFRPFFLNDVQNETLNLENVILYPQTIDLKDKNLPPAFTEGLLAAVKEISGYTETQPGVIFINRAFIDEMLQNEKASLDTFLESIQNVTSLETRNLIEQFIKEDKPILFSFIIHPNGKRDHFIIKIPTGLELADTPMEEVVNYFLENCIIYSSYGRDPFKMYAGQYEVIVSLILRAFGFAPSSQIIRL